MLDGKRHGQGKLTYLDGTVEEGRFYDSVLHGWAKVIYRDGTVEEGEFKDGW